MLLIRVGVGSACLTFLTFSFLLSLPLPSLIRLSASGVGELSRPCRQDSTDSKKLYNFLECQAQPFRLP
jgi:hypothetical protein